MLEADVVVKFVCLSIPSRIIIVAFFTNLTSKLDPFNSIKDYPTIDWDTLINETKKLSIPSRIILFPVRELIFSPLLLSIPSRIIYKLKDRVIDAVKKLSIPSRIILAGRGSCYVRG